MREINFRAISMCKGGHWLYGDIRHYAKNPHTEKWTIYDSVTGIETDIDDMTIGEFTGLHDKNGQKIYEGDIVVRRDLVFCTENVCEVVYNGEIASFRLHYKNGVHTERNAFISSDTYNDGYCTVDVKYEYEVIGNIYDNPEMLRKK